VLISSSSCLDGMANYMSERRDEIKRSVLFWASLLAKENANTEQVLAAQKLSDWILELINRPWLVMVVVVTTSFGVLACCLCKVIVKGGPRVCALDKGTPSHSHATTKNRVV
jgi:hypothetical protein